MNSEDLVPKIQRLLAQRAEMQHALEHILSCDSGTKLCPDCQRLAKAALSGTSWVHFVDDEK